MEGFTFNEDAPSGFTYLGGRGPSTTVFGPPSTTPVKRVPVVSKRKIIRVETPVDTPVPVPAPLPAPTVFRPAIALPYTPVIPALPVIPGDIDEQEEPKDDSRLERARLKGPVPPATSTSTATEASKLDLLRQRLGISSQLSVDDEIELIIEEASRGNAGTDLRKVKKLHLLEYIKKTPSLLITNVTDPTYGYMVGSQFSPIQAPDIQTPRDLNPLLLKRYLLSIVSDGVIFPAAPIFSVPNTAIIAVRDPSNPGDWKDLEVQIEFRTYNAAAIAIECFYGISNNGSHPIAKSAIMEFIVLFVTNMDAFWQTLTPSWEDILRKQMKALWSAAAAPLGKPLAELKKMISLPAVTKTYTELTSDIDVSTALTAFRYAIGDEIQRCLGKQYERAEQ